MSSRPTLGADFRSRLRRDGYARMDRVTFGFDEEILRAFEAFWPLWDDLLPDPYVDATPCPRLRRHAAFRYDGHADALVDLPPAGYYQSRRSNPLFGGQPRVFAPFTEAARCNRFLRELAIRGARQLSTGVGEMPIHAHMVRIVGFEGLRGEPSPEGQHQDGFDYVSLHLMKRENACGGETKIEDPDGRCITRMLLARPLDSLYIDDRRLFHGTSPINATRPGSAVRDVLLLSYGHGDSDDDKPTASNGRQR